MRCPNSFCVVAPLLALFLLGGCVATKQAPLTSFDGSGASGELEIRLFAVNDLDSFRAKWEKSDRAPNEQSEIAVLTGGSVHLPVLFNGCAVEGEGNCQLYGRLVIVNADSDEVVYRGQRVRLWSNREPAALGSWSMATHVPNVTVTEGGAPMRVVFEVSDDVREETAQAGLILRTE